MYLHCIFEELRKEGKARKVPENPIDLDHLPEELPGYYRDHWARLWSRKNRRRETLEVLLLLCVQR